MEIFGTDFFVLSGIPWAFLILMIIAAGVYTRFRYVATRYRNVRRNLVEDYIIGVILIIAAGLLANIWIFLARHPIHM